MAVYDVAVLIPNSPTTGKMTTRAPGASDSYNFPRGVRIADGQPLDVNSDNGTRIVFFPGQARFQWYGSTRFAWADIHTWYTSGGQVQWSGSSSDAAASKDTLIGRTDAAVVGVRGSSNSVGGSLSLLELAADPAAPASNDSRLYTRDNGSGKTQLCVRFASGAVQVIATEP